ncbi:MAG: hypothetical protein ACI9R3_000520 [Verrucomicrobiales bacterium]|jgi:hypothetical protein
MISKFLNSSVPVSGRQFGMFRIALGLYLVVHFFQLLPWAGELFGGQGVMANADANLLPKILPNPMWNAQDGRVAFCCIMTGVVAGIGIVIGRYRAFWCILAWLIWAWLFARNNLILNPSMPYVGLLLLICACLPQGEACVVGKRADSEWKFPAMAWWSVWILLAVGYTYSGVAKLSSPSWIDGSALREVIDNPLARDHWPRQLFLVIPDMFTNIGTWMALILEILFLPLALFRPTRLIAWCAMVAMHLGILVLIDFADLTLGMLLAHAFVFRADWCHSLQQAMPGTRKQSGHHVRPAHR